MNSLTGATLRKSEIPLNNPPATTAGAPVRAPGADQQHSRATLMVAVLCFGGLTASLMQTLVIPIQSHLPQLLDTSEANASWVITSTLLAGAVTMPVAGRMADMFGKKRVLIVSTVVLLLGTVLAALAESFTPMVCARLLQGVAMGYVPVGISLVREIVPPRMAPLAIASISATMGIGGSIGMPAAAWVADSGDWHWIFWCSAILACLSLAGTVLFLPDVEDRHPARLDVVGIVGLALGLAGVLMGISMGKSWGWGSLTTWGCILGGALVLAAWARFELHHDDPLVDLRTSIKRPVLLTNVGAMLIGFGMMASSITVPQLMLVPHLPDAGLDHGLGQTMLQAGLWMAPGGVVMMLMAPLSSRLINSVGARITMAIGATCLGVAYLLGLFLMGEPVLLMVAMMVSSAGVGLGFAAMPTLILDNVPMAEAGAAVGLNGLMRAVGTTLAGAVIAAVLLSDTVGLGGADIPTAHAFRMTFLVGAAGAFVGAVITLCIPKKRTAQPTH